MNLNFHQQQSPSIVTTIHGMAYNTICNIIDYGCNNQSNSTIPDAVLTNLDLQNVKIPPDYDDSNDDRNDDRNDISNDHTNLSISPKSNVTL